MRVRSSSTIRYAVIAGILVLVLVAIAALSAQQDSGAVEGVTLFVVKGHPGALTGKPEAGYKAPEPAIAPNEKVYWLRIGAEKRKRLFAVQSDGEGKFRIELPPGDYFAEPASTHPDLRRLSPQQCDDEETLVNILFPTWRLQGKPDVKVEKGQIYKFDVEAKVLFVD